MSQSVAAMFAVSLLCPFSSLDLTRIRELWWNNDAIPDHQVFILNNNDSHEFKNVLMISTNIMNCWHHFQADFDEQVKSAGDKIVVIDFFATWCGPCKVISPFLEKLSQQYATNIVVVKVRRNSNHNFYSFQFESCCHKLRLNLIAYLCLSFIQVDVDECEELAMKYDISSMPTFVFLKNGEKVLSFSGANPDKLEKTIVELIA